MDTLIQEIPNERKVFNRRYLNGHFIRYNICFEHEGYGFQYGKGEEMPFWSS